jgi:hypothetical protein
MEDKDIVGREFTCFKFKEIDVHVTYSSTYESFEGCKAVVKNLHSSYPHYANATVTLKNGKTRDYHYPTAMIKEQIEKEDESKSIDDILNELKQLLSNI